MHCGEEDGDALGLVTLESGTFIAAPPAIP